MEVLPVTNQFVGFNSEKGELTFYLGGGKWLSNRLTVVAMRRAHYGSQPAVTSRSSDGFVSCIVYCNSSPASS